MLSDGDMQDNPFLNVRLFKQLYTTNAQPSYCSGRRTFLSLRWTSFGQKCATQSQVFHRTLSRFELKLVKLSSPVRCFQYRHGLKSHSVRKKLLLQKNCKKTDRLQFANVHRSDETIVKLFCHNDHQYI